jgi:hypothetical protein
MQVFEKDYRLHVKHSLEEEAENVIPSIHVYESNEIDDESKDVAHCILDGELLA